MKVSNQRGIAIVTALFVTALVATFAVAMLTRLHTDIRRTELLLNNNQANLYAAGSLAWAMDQLINNLQQQQPGKIVDRTPIRSPINAIKGGKIWSVIYDAQGKINLNNLSDPLFQAEFTRLITLVAPNINPESAKNITLGIVDWITPGLNNSLFDQYYAKRKPPYRSAHRLMVSVSELRMLRDMTPELFTRLAAVTTALPEKTALNLNSAAIPVLLSLSPEMTLETAQAVVALRKQTPLISSNNLNNFPALKNAPLAQNNLTFISSYFLIQTNVIIGEQTLQLNTLVHRLAGKPPRVMIIWQSKGTL